jgi:predicted lipoprotein with Yx(FWY)xxD motif
MFVPDKQGASTCYGACAVQWPPLVLPSGVTEPETGPGADEELLGTVRRSDGSVQVTYNHWPLYLWFGDTSSGMHTGQGLNNLGGLWYVLSPTGIPIRH